MKYVMLSVRDSAMDAFAAPFTVRAIGQAIRSFSDEVNRPESPMFAHPSDYELFHVGTFDEETGLVEAVSPPRSVARAADQKRPPGEA